jgi:DNA mismatch repair ATPase MutS
VGNVVHADGVAIAWAVSEELIGLGAYTLFATHFTALSELAELYPNAMLWHFTVDSSPEVMVTLSSRIKHGRRVQYTIQMP